MCGIIYEHLVTGSATKHLMDPDRWKQIDRLLQSALTRQSGERDAFLRQACAGDVELEREVRSLLAAQREAGSGVS